MKSAYKKQLALLWVVVILFCIFGIAALFLSFRMYSENSRFIASAIPAKGVVIDFEEHLSDSGAFTNYARIGFTDSEGKAVAFNSPVGSAVLLDLKRGDTVGVLYEKLNSKNARVNAFGTLWFGTVIILILGIISIILPIILFNKIVFYCSRQED